MSPITQVSSDILRWNRLGLFAVPEDSAESYTERACFLLGSTPQEETQEARTLVQHCYDIDPFWVSIVFSKKNLLPWEAGCTWWSEELAESPLIQLHSFFEKKKRYLGLYDRDEVLAHEYVHAVRGPLASDRFEEFFAYFTSIQSGQGLFRLFRFFFGPLFENPREPIIFVGALLVAFLGIFIQLLFFDESVLWPLGALVGLLTAFFFGRLCLRWRCWYSCRRQLESIIGDKALAVMIRLCDDEVLLFGQLSPEKIINWIEEQRKTNFRWQLLFQAYFHA
jgi:hypothetical protein